MNDFLIIITTSILSGIFSTILILSITYFYIHKRFKKKLEILVDEYIVIFKEKLKLSFHEAGEELLPKFKQEVKDGFKETITESLGRNAFEEAAKQISKMSSSIIQNSLNLFVPPFDSPKNNKD